MSVSFSDESDITLHIDCAFGDDPLTAVPTWVDISADVRSFKTKRGRNHLGDRTRTGKAEIILDNTSGDYTPFNTAGAQTPNVLPMVPFRISAEYTVAGAFAIGDDADSNGILDVGEVPLFTGFIESWQPRWTDGTDMTTRVKVSDGIRLWNQFTATGKQFGGTTARVAIADLLVDLGWPAAWIDGFSSSVELLHHVPRGNGLGALRRIEDTDGGDLFIQADGHSMFHPRGHRTSRVVVDTFGDGASEYRYTHDPTFEADDHQIWNSVAVTRRGGSTQTSTDATSILSYGERSLRRSDTLHTSNTDASTLAAALLALYKDPHLRFERFDIFPRSDPTNLWPVALAYDVAQKVTLKRIPATGDTIDIDAFIEGIEHRVSATDWRTSFTVSQYA